MFPIRDTKTSGQFPFINLILIVTNIYVFIQELFSPNLELFINQYALIPVRINLLELESLKPFVTSLFLHAGFMHILSNMWFLWVFGDNIESRIGHIKYLFFYIFYGIAASFIQYLFIASSTLPMLGASGAIAGILGAYLKFFPKNKIDTLIPIFGLPMIIAFPANIMLIYWFITQAFNGVAAIFVQTASIGGIAYLAHAGGFVTGLISASTFTLPKRY